MLGRLQIHYFYYFNCCHFIGCWFIFIFSETWRQTNFNRRSQRMGQQTWKGRKYCRVRHWLLYRLSHGPWLHLLDFLYCKTKTKKKLILKFWFETFYFFNILIIKNSKILFFLLLLLFSCRLMDFQDFLLELSKVENTLLKKLAMLTTIWKLLANKVVSLKLNTWQEIKKFPKKIRVNWIYFLVAKSKSTSIFISILQWFSIQTPFFKLKEFWRNKEQDFRTKTQDGAKFLEFSNHLPFCLAFSS